MEQHTFKRLGVMLDCSRNAVMKPERLKEYIDILSRLGYNCLMLYTEDTYEIEGQPYFGHNRGRYSREELRELDAYARERGIELMPCIQTLAHLKAIFRWPVYRKIQDCDDILLAGEEETYALIDAMFRTLSQVFTSRVVNIGLDEAHMVGRGKYQDLHGCRDHMDIFLEHLRRVSEIAKKYGFELLMWSDMFFRILNEKNGGGYYDGVDSIPEEITGMIPDNVTPVYWDYYSTDTEHYRRNLKSNALLKDGIWFAGGLWSWAGITPHNAYAIQATRAAVDACREQKIDNMLFTVWGDNGGECSAFAVLPALFCAAAFARGCRDMAEIRADFRKEFGIGFDDFMLLDLPGTPGGKDEPVGPEKNFLYNDCFMGLFDTLIGEDFGTRYGYAADRLSALATDSSFGLLFRAEETLARVLSRKCSLGLRTRAAYASGDKGSLQTIISDYDAVIQSLREYYAAYEALWMWEKKPHGFDVQDVRLGGLITRVEHCKARLQQYLDGAIPRIEELEEPLLDVHCRENDHSPVCCNSWEESFTSNRVYGV